MYKPGHLQFISPSLPPSLSLTVYSQYEQHMGESHGRHIVKLVCKQRSDEVVADSLALVYRLKCREPLIILVKAIRQKTAQLDRRVIKKANTDNDCHPTLRNLSPPALNIRMNGGKN